MKVIDEIDLFQIIKEAWGDKFLIVVLVLISSLSMIIYSLSLPNIYKSEIVLAPVNQSENMSSIIRSYGSIASMAGINIPQGASSRSDQAIQVLKSYQFFSDLSSNSNILPYMYAVERWDENTNRLIFNDDIYDVKNNRWITKENKKTQPSLQEAFLSFSKMFKVSEDKSIGIIKLSIDHLSPYVAQELLINILDQIHSQLREEDRLDAINSINFLNSRINETSLAETKVALSELIKDKTQTLMLIEASSNYIFKVIDPPIASEFKSKPNRGLMCIFAAFFGFALGVFISITKNFLIRKVS